MRKPWHIEQRHQESRRLTTKAPSLPMGISPVAWEQERSDVQNPRIRTFLGCILLLDELFESDFSLLHCSPKKLRQIWQGVRSLSQLLSTELRPALDGESQIPQLEEARSKAADALDALDGTVLSELDRFAEDPPDEQLGQIRRLLCSSMGQIRSFLHDTFGRIIASDPRSIRDADYYVSRRFPHEIEEAELLHEMVEELFTYLKGLEPGRAVLRRLLVTLDQERRLPDDQEWLRVSGFLDTVLEDLTAKLRGIVGSRGIRFEEMTVLSRYALDIPTRCHRMMEARTLGNQTFATLQEEGEAAGSVRTVEQLFRQRLSELATKLDQDLNDLTVFIPIWLHNIGNRRALVLKRAIEGEE